MKKYTITTLGCKVNQSESDAIVRQLKGAGWTSASSEDTADICIVNTCTVTGKASMQSRQAARQAIRSHPGARVIVTGCYAQTEPEALETIEGVSDIIGQTGKTRIPQMILRSEARSSIPEIALPIEGQDPADLPGQERDRGIRSRPFLKVQDGCDSFCTYCIVPYARGRSRSMKIEDVLDRIGQMGRDGYHEIVMTGIHLGHYGMDLVPYESLVSLLSHILTLPDTPRIRLSSIEPGELTDEIVRLVAESGRFCRHFHIPLQSGDDTILRRMHRPYDRELFRDLVLDVRNHIPDAGIGADILIGFPGETEDAFRQTYGLIEELPITYLHVFPYSPRKGTPAYGYPDQVSIETIKERCSRMRALGIEKKQAFYRRFIGKNVEIVLEDRRIGTGGVLKGMTSNYIPVQIRAEEPGFLPGSLRNVLAQARIEGLEAGRVVGTLLADREITD